MSGKALARRLGRVDAALAEMQLHRWAAEFRMPVDEVRRELAWLRHDRMLHPRPVLPNGQVDLEPFFLRVAADLGVDPEVALAEARRIIAERGW